MIMTENEDKRFKNNLKDNVFENSHILGICN